VLARALDAALTGLTSPEAVSEAARKLVAIDRERLAAIDPDLPAALDELEAESEAELSAWLATVLPSPEPETSAEPSSLEEFSPAPSPAAQGHGGLAFLAAAGPRVPDAARTLDQGGSYLSSVGQVAGAVSDFVAQTKPDKDSSRDPSSPFVQGNTRFEVHSARVRDVVTFGITLSETYSVPSRTPDQPPISVTDSGEAIVIVDVCPDEDGTVVATATTSATVDAAGNGLSYRVVADAEDRAVATVNSRANIASIVHTGSMSRHATGDRAVFASAGEGIAESHLVGTTSWTSDASGTATGPASVDIQVADGANEADIRAWALTRALAAALTDTAVTAGPRVWRDGKRCLELKADPPGKEVEQGSETEITVTIHHTAYDDEIERDVTAMLEGTEEIDPLDSPVRAPAPFTYTATDEPEGEGTVTFESVSNRGVAKELPETYRVVPRLRLDIHGTVTFKQGPVTAKGTLTHRDLIVRLVPGPTPEDPPGVTVEGDGTLKATARSPGCSGSGSKTFPVDDGVDASARLTGTPEDRKLAILVRPVRRDDQIRLRIRCERGSVTVRLKLSSFWPTLSESNALLPLSGGTVRAQGSVQGARYDITFTLRRESPAA
jgi:hypothetical protein